MTTFQILTVISPYLIGLTFSLLYAFWLIGRIRRHDRTYKAPQPAPRRRAF